MDAASAAMWALHCLFMVNGELSQKSKLFAIGCLLGASTWKFYEHFQLGGDHEVDPEFPGGISYPI